jgi:hypothetical protein
MFFPNLYNFFPLNFTATYSNISNEQLDLLVREAQNRNPNIGIRLTKGFLMGKGHRVQHCRIRDSLIRTDPVGMMDRWAKAVRRRKYKVHSPLSLWHIDGNHKLIRYFYGH